MPGIRFKVSRANRRGSFPLAVVVGILFLGPLLGWGSREADDASAASTMPEPSEVVRAKQLMAVDSGMPWAAWSLTSWHRDLLKAKPSGEEAARGFQLEEPSELHKASRRRLWATYYYLPSVRSARSGIPLRDLAGRPLGPRVSRRDWCEAALQGSVQVQNGNDIRILNFAGRTGSHAVDCSSYYRGRLGRTKFRDARGRYGDGVKGFSLVPYRTMAVDPRVIPHGSVIYVPAARGTVVSLPNGDEAVHDGYFFAADSGSAIKGSHVDVYLGPARRNPFAWVRSTSRRGFDAYVLRFGSELESLSSLHGRPKS